MTCRWLPPRRGGSRRVALLALLLGLVACTRSPTPGERLGLSPCRLPGLGVPAECGTYTVYEDREARSGRTIDLYPARVPALAATPEPDPLFVLVGGPGQAATRAGAPVVHALEAVRRRRDIVLVDQRGTGRSNPLRCQKEPLTLAEALEPEIDPKQLEECLDSLDADPTHYVTAVAMDDLDEIRDAFGYERINLWGASYGTRAALVYMRRHGAHVRAAILDGVAPPGMKLPLYAARDAQRALDRLFADCRQSPRCHATFPSPEADLDAVLERLSHGPLAVELPHPRTGEPVTLSLTRRSVVSGVRGLLYAPRYAALLPMLLSRAQAGDFAPFVAATSLFSGSVEEGIADGMFLSVICAEDVAWIQPGEVEAAVQGTFAGDALVRTVEAACAHWPTARIPASYLEPVTSEVPVLIFSGDLDPVTPPVWGERVHRWLARSRHIVVSGAGHGVSLLGCAPALVADFLDSADPAAVDPSCLARITRPPFFTSFAGPAP